MLCWGRPPTTVNLFRVCLVVKGFGRPEPVPLGGCLVFIFIFTKETPASKMEVSPNQFFPLKMKIIVKTLQRTDHPLEVAASNSVRHFTL